MSHYPVMKEQVLNWLSLRDGGIYVDATCGYGGHSMYLLEAGKNIFLYGLDKDGDAVKAASQKLAGFKNFKAVHSGYENLDSLLKDEGLESVDGILMDLGFSTNQIRDGERGFSFQEEGPIDMRYDRRQGLTAGEIINTWSRNDLVWIFENYGEIKKAGKFVDRIIERRRKKRFETTVELADFLKQLCRHKTKIHPATKFFMALRISANNETEVIKDGLAKAAGALKKGGRLVVISFHSIEDRIVKRFFRDNTELAALTKKPLTADKKELAENPESRSAKLRACEKI